MEEEDESRGKTEESGEDRGDGPPDRDPTLSPPAFILVRLSDAWGRGREGQGSPDSWALTPGPPRRRVGGQDSWPVCRV